MVLRPRWEEKQNIVPIQFGLRAREQPPRQPVDRRLALRAALRVARRSVIGSTAHR
jgi:hypothetical protein